MGICFTFNFPFVFVNFTFSFRFLFGIFSIYFCSAVVLFLLIMHHPVYRSCFVHILEIHRLSWVKILFSDISIINTHVLYRQPWRCKHTLTNQFSMQMLSFCHSDMIDIHIISETLTFLCLYYEKFGAEEIKTKFTFIVIRVVR